MKRKFSELIEYLMRDNLFPDGAFLLTGTGIVPPDSFTLEPGDEIRIESPEIGVLTNRVVRG
jgi:2-dehydro-3-deoxy-D-arabinonate dehydratase